jgi:glyceraldehyde 3-phosphate dehydrogenase
VREVIDSHLDAWNEKITLAEQMIPILGLLYRQRGLVLRMFGRKMVPATTIDIVKAHRFARLIVGNELDIKVSFEMLQKIGELSLCPARLDLGKLAQEYLVGEQSDMDAFLNSRLTVLMDGCDERDIEPKDVVLYGFGRIGRILTRLLVDRAGSGEKMRLRAVVVRSKGDEVADLLKRASLLRRDSVHGNFEGSVSVDREKRVLVVNGNYIQFIYAGSPSDIDYTAYGINDALVVDNTGVWKDEAGLGQHLKAKGVAKVLLTAPAKGDIKNIVYGINNDILSAEDNILSAASCTTNAIVPVLKVINDKFGIKSGHVETIHSYTNDQNLIDNYHSADRRGRSAPLNMVLTSTGAAKAIAKAVPELAGKLTGNAIRVPTPNVSMVVTNLNLGRETTREEMNNFLRDVSYNSRYQDQIGSTWSTEVVSSDMVGTTAAGVVDGEATIVEGDRAVLYVWYDNEAGYSNQLVRLMQQYVGLDYPEIPART